MRTIFSSDSNFLSLLYLTNNLYSSKVFDKYSILSLSYFCLNVKSIFSFSILDIDSSKNWIFLFFCDNSFPISSILFSYSPTTSFLALCPNAWVNVWFIWIKLLFLCFISATYKLAISILPIKRDFSFIHALYFRPIYFRILINSYCSWTILFVVKDSSTCCGVLYGLMVDGFLWIMIFRDWVYAYFDGWFGMLFYLFDCLYFYGFYFDTYKSFTYSFFTGWLVFTEWL